jgi:hypothetical protein
MAQERLVVREIRHRLDAYDDEMNFDLSPESQEHPRIRIGAAQKKVTVRFIVQATSTDLDYKDFQPKLVQFLAKFPDLVVRVGAEEVLDCKVRLYLCFITRLLQTN